MKIIHVIIIKKSLLHKASIHQFQIPSFDSLQKMWHNLGLHQLTKEIMNLQHVTVQYLLRYKHINLVRINQIKDTADTIKTL